LRGKEVEAKIKSFTPHVTIWVTNLNEDRLERLKPVDGEITLSVGAHKIVTLLMKCERSPKSSRGRCGSVMKGETALRSQSYL